MWRAIKVVVFVVLGAAAAALSSWAATPSSESDLEALAFNPMRQDPSDGYTKWLFKDRGSGADDLFVAYERSSFAYTHLRVFKIKSAPKLETLEVKPRPSWVLDPVVRLPPGRKNLDDYRRDLWMASGWPWRQWCWSAAFQGFSRQLDERDAVRIRWDGENYFFGSRPIWPGLLANAAFYGVLVWGLWCAPGAIRRTVRRRWGVCVRCGYDLRGGGARCPECGEGFEDTCDVMRPCGEMVGSS
jgi:hypothetical protein